MKIKAVSCIHANTKVEFSENLHPRSSFPKALLLLLLFGDLKTFAQNVFGSKAENHILCYIQKRKKQNIFEHVDQP